MSGEGFALVYTQTRDDVGGGGGGGWRGGALYGGTRRDRQRSLGAIVTANTAGFDNEGCIATVSVYSTERGRRLAHAGKEEYGEDAWLHELQGRRLAEWGSRLTS